METGHADEPGRLWAGTIPGGLFHSEDRGESWSLVRPLWDDPRRRRWFGGGYDKPGVHSISVDPRDPRRVAVAVSCAGLGDDRRRRSWRSAVTGFEPPTCRPNRPETRRSRIRIGWSGVGFAGLFWIQHHNGVFRAVDGIDRWTEIATPQSGFGSPSPSIPEIPILPGSFPA